MANIGVLIGVGAPTSLAIDLANKFDMTLSWFCKRRIALIFIVIRKNYNKKLKILKGKLCQKI